MKTRIYITIFFLISAFFCFFSFAATEQWRKDPVGFIYQIVADGKGGCAYVYADTNFAFSVVWLDKKGEVKFQETLISFLPLHGPVILCTPKQLIYSDAIGLPSLVQVDKKGVPAQVPSFKGYLYPVLGGGLPKEKLTDKKGFFVVNVDTNAPLAESLVRYSKK